MTFKHEVLMDRYTAFDKYRKQSPFYDNELSSHIILSFKDVITALKTTTFSSDRKKQQFEKISEYPFSKPIINFYGKWLMYMDGKPHADARKLITTALSKSTKDLDEIVERYFNFYFKKTFLHTESTLNIVSTFSVPFVTSILSTIFGISTKRYFQIINISKPIVIFLGNGDLDNEKSRSVVINSLHETHNLLLKCIEECNKNNSFISVLLQNNVSVNDISPLLINILIDGYAPLLATLNTYLLNVSQGVITNNSMTSSQIFDELVRLETPFQYCARIAKENIELRDYLIKKGGRIMAFISSANRDPEYFYSPKNIQFRNLKYKNVSFGIGQHICPGWNMTKKITEKFIDLFENSREKMSILHLEERWTDTLGFRFLEKLFVEKNKVTS